MSLFDRIKNKWTIPILVGACATGMAITAKTYNIEVRDNTPVVDSSYVAKTFVGEKFTLLGYDYNFDGVMDAIEKSENITYIVGNKPIPHDTVFFQGDREFNPYNKILADSGRSYQSRKN